MTTFIDFRYAPTISEALFKRGEQEETEIAVYPDKENYLAFELLAGKTPVKLFRLVFQNQHPVASFILEKDSTISMKLNNGKTIFRSPQWLQNKLKNEIVCIYLGPDKIGLKYHENKCEKNIPSLQTGNEILYIDICNDKAIRILGRGSGRAKQWAKLYYHRSKPDGLGVELIFDWHHLRAGIPIVGTMIAEYLIGLSNFRLKFRSYIFQSQEAETTDFPKLFADPEPSDVSIHILPPIYSYPNPDTFNIGFFVYESMSVHPSVVSRCNSMSFLIVPSTFVAGAFRKNKVRSPIYVVPYGVDTEFFRPVDRRIALPQARSFNFLAVSSYVDRKNIKYLVRAFLEEFREHEDIALILLLRPEYFTTQNNVALSFSEWEQRHWYKSAPILLSTSYISNENLANLIANANAYVMPSNEGFGLTLLEAMACETPVIGLNYGGVLDFLNKTNGYLVPTGRPFISKNIDQIAYFGDRFYTPNVRSLRKIMRHVYENPDEASKLARKARKDCETSFSWNRTATDIIDIIENQYPLQKHHSKKNIVLKSSKKISNILSWVICVMDDEPIKQELRYFKNKKQAGNYIVFLFTRYARSKDILTIRKKGFLYYLWDGTKENCYSILRTVLADQWAGIFYPGEKIKGSLDLLSRFLDNQPEEINGVSIPCNNEQLELRFIRPQSFSIIQNQTVFRDINITKRHKDKKR